MNVLKILSKCDCRFFAEKKRGGSGIIFGGRHSEFCVADTLPLQGDTLEYA